MKVNLLKRIRRRYSIKYEVNHIVVGDNKKKCVTPYWSLQDFLINYVYDNIGLITGSQYEKRVARRRKYSEWLKLFKP